MIGAFVSRDYVVILNETKTQRHQLVQSSDVALPVRYPHESFQHF